jgi:hypothetical protein
MPTKWDRSPEAYNGLRAVRTLARGEALETIRRGFESPISMLVSRAAELAAEVELDEAIPAMVAAYEPIVADH